MYEDRRSGFRLATVLCGCALALAAVGCGGDDDDDEADASAAETTEATGSGEEVSMEGTWAGDVWRVHQEDGSRSNSVVLEVDEQEELTFSGTITWSTPEGDMSAPVIGSMSSPDGALMAGSGPDGPLLFEMVDEDTLDYCHIESGDDGITVCGRLDKQD
mgnify:CR=1 FL=1